MDSVIGDRCPTLEDIRALRFTTRVINESMRLYPQPPVLIRRALEEDTLGGFPLKKGADMFISVWNIHRSAPKALHKLGGTSRQPGACERLCSVLNWVMMLGLEMSLMEVAALQIRELT